MTDDELISTTAWAILWFSAGGMMLIHATLHYTGHVPIDAPTYWLALVLILSLSVVQTIEYLRKRWPR